MNNRLPFTFCITAAVKTDTEPEKIFFVIKYGEKTDNPSCAYAAA